MDHEQQLAQLREFEHSQPEDAQSYATKSFLETLDSLIKHGLEAQDDGSDGYKEELKVIKDAIRAFSIVLPFVFKTVCQNEAESHLWELARSLLTLVETRLIEHKNTGVRISALKCLQVIFLLLTKSAHQKEISIHMLRAGHRLLNLQALEKEGQAVFDKIADLLKSDIESVLTATISCLVVMVKKRTHYLQPVMSLFTGWSKTRSKEDSPVMMRNVEKALKLALVTFIRTDAFNPYRTDMIAAFGAMGGNVGMFSSRRSEDSRRLKRQQQQQQYHDQEREKRIKTDYMPTIPTGQNRLANYDITAIPLDKIVSLCMTVLQMVPLEVMSERAAMLPPEGVTLAVTRKGFKRSTTPPYPPPPEQPEHIHHTRIKREQDMTEAKPVLASAQERASQALKMQPYALATPQTLDASDKKTLLKMTIERLLEAEAAFRVENPSKNVWLLLVAKLMTRGTTAKPTTDDLIILNKDEPLEETKPFVTELETSSDLKQLLLDFVVQHLSSRLDLALEWLHEEYLMDKRNARIDPDYQPNYFYWLHTLLEKSIPTLDAKDRVLTKLLLDAPELDQKVIDLVQQNLNVPERFVSCVSTLRSLVTNRPPIRLAALQVLLDLCTNPNDKMRRTSIVAVKKWNTNQEEMNGRVESFAIKSLHALKSTEWTEKDVVRHAELYFVLCTKKPSLLQELFTVYKEATETVQDAIRIHMSNMIKSIGMRSHDMIRLMKTFPLGTETLVIRMLSILCESKPPTKDILAVVQTITPLAKERSMDTTQLSPILAGQSLSSSST